MQPSSITSSRQTSPAFRSSARAASSGSSAQSFIGMLLLPAIQVRACVATGAGMWNTLFVFEDSIRT
jgi:hypothetical protein